MKAKHSQVVQEEFGRAADKIVDAPSFHDEEVLGRVLQAVAARPDERILDVACGTGVVTFQLGKVAREVVGLDLTRPLLQKARQRRHDCDMMNVFFELGEAQALPFGDGEFDAAVCRMSIHHFEHPRQAIQEMARVTRPGGRVVIADVVTTDDPPQARLHNALERLRDPSHVRMLTEAELLKLIGEGGLQVQGVQRWQQARGFEEWVELTNAPEREEPLRVVLENLVSAQLEAGIHLRRGAKGQLLFEHAWCLVRALRGPLSSA